MDICCIGNTEFKVHLAMAQLGGCHITAGVDLFSYPRDPKAASATAWLSFSGEFQH